MTDHVIKHTVKIETDNGVFMDEFDCEVECTVKLFDGDPYLHSIDAITVTNGRGLDLKVADLLNPESGRLPHLIGKAEAVRLMSDREFQSRAIERHEEEQNNWGNAADARRAVMMAE